MTARLHHEGVRPLPGFSLDPGMELIISTAPVDEEWDDFLNAQPGAYYYQSSPWAYARASNGWRPLRILLTRYGSILGGAQILVRTLGRVLAVGYLDKGPVPRQGEPPERVIQLIQATDAAAKRSGLDILRVQPAPQADGATKWLHAHGYSASMAKIGLVAEWGVDLSPPEEFLLANMSATARRHIRVAERNGVRVRFGSQDDLGSFHQLLVETGARKGFPVRPYLFHKRLWDAFQGVGRCELLLAEADGQLLAAALLIPFSDTVYFVLGASSGERPDLHAPRLLHWEAMRWAKHHGFRRYNFESIDRPAAERLTRGEGLSAPEDPRLGVTRFKLGFGGEAKLLPILYEKGFGPFAPIVRTPLFRDLSRSRSLQSWLRREEVQRDGN